MRAAFKLSMDELKIGDILVSQANPERKFTIKAIIAGMRGPYLTLTDMDGIGVEHDCSFDCVSAKYTVLR
jgi:hypothetical protein